MATTSKTTETVYETISKVLADVKAVEKTQSNNGLRFRFQGIEDIVNALHPLFGKHGLSIRATRIDWHQTDVNMGKSAGVRILGTICYEISNRAGQTSEAVVLSEGVDTGDKATGKFMSYGYKALLKQLFMIPTNDTDPDTYSPQVSPAHTPISQGQVEFITKHVTVDKLPTIVAWAARTVSHRELSEPVLTGLTATEADAIIAKLKEQAGKGE